MPDTPQLGPVALCTLIANDGQALVEAYCGWLHQQVAAAGALDADTAQALGHPQLAGERCWLLANTRGRRWLQVVEHSQATPRDSLHSYGWLAMEVLVEAVDTVTATLENSPFEMLRAPADLDISDQIRACQVRGPAGEILYLTQVNAEVPPFQLPRCEAPVDHLFIPVLCTPSRERSLAQYSAISGTDGISFDTRITVINQARQFELDRRHPVATLQLAGRCLIEIDQIADTSAPAAGVNTGMANVAFHCAGEMAESTAALASGPFAGHRASAHQGCAGEYFTLIQPSTPSTTSTTSTGA